MNAALEVIARRKPRPRALILPYGACQFMTPGEQIWESLAGPARGRVEIFGLTPGWGLLAESALVSSSSLLHRTRPLCKRRAARDTAARVRAWLATYGRVYETVGLVAYGPLMTAWSRALRGSPDAKRVRVIRVNGKWRGLAGSDVRRQVCSLVRR